MEVASQLIRGAQQHRVNRGISIVDPRICVKDLDNLGVEFT